MIRLITSNIIPIRSIKDYNDNFIICYLHTSLITPHNPPKTKYIFEIYYQTDMLIDEEETDHEMVFNYHPVSTITEALDKIADFVQYEVETEMDKDEDLRDEVTVGVCCDYSWNTQVVKYLNSNFADHELEFECLNLYQYLKIVRVERLVQTLKGALGTEFIYPEDPVNFGYALHLGLAGLV